MAVILSLNPSTEQDGSLLSPDWGFSRNGDISNTPIVVDDSVTYGSGKSLLSSVISDGTLNTYRAEITGGTGSTSPIGTNRKITAGLERWIGFSVMCTSNTNVEMNSFNTTFFQVLTETSDILGQRHPNFIISMSKGRFIIEQKYDTTLNQSISDSESVINRDIGSCVKNVWYRFVIHVIFNNAGNGLIELFLDGALVYRSTEPNGYNDTGKTQYLKFGNYTSSWKSGTPSVLGSVTQWSHDYIMIGDDSSSLTEMMDTNTSLMNPSLESRINLSTSTHTPRSNNIIEDFSDIDSWSVTASTPETTNIYPDIRYSSIGNSCFSFESGLASGVNAMVNKNLTINLSESGGLWIYWNNRYLVQNTTQGLTFYLSHSTNLSSGVGRVQAIGRFNPQSFGKTCEWISNNDLTTIDGTPNFSNDWLSTRLLIQSATQDIRRYSIDGIGLVNQSTKPKARIIITLDDNTDTGYSIGHEEAYSRGIPLTHYIISNSVDDVGHSTTAQLNLMKSRGDYIGVHGNSQWYPNINTLSTDIINLRNQGIADLSHGAWPEGVFGYGNEPEKIIKQAKNLGLKSIRKTSAGGNGCFDPRYQEMGALPAKSLGSSLSLSQAKTFVDRAIESGGTIIFYGHKFGSFSDSTTWVTSDWISLLDYLVEKRELDLLDCMTIKQMYNETINGK